jgi:Ca-activated chloride channel family protein
MSLIALLTVPLLASQTFKLARGQTVYVVALRNLGGAGVFVPCPPTGMNPRLITFPAPELVPGTGEAIQGGIPDAEIKGRVEKEFQKQNKYKLAASAEVADLLFLVDAKFESIVMATQRVPGRPDAVYWIGLDDQKSNFLRRAIAIVVPSSIYRKNPADIDTLVKARLWESEVGSYNETPASPEELVKLFQKGEQAHQPVVVNRSGAGSRSQDARTPESSGRTVCAAPQPRRAQVPKEIQPAGPPPRTSGTGQPAAAAQQDVPAVGASIKVDVTLVTVPVLVTDSDGKNVYDLKARDFHIYEDNVEQKIDTLIPESEPFNVALMMDTSSSVRSHFEEIKKAAATFVEALRPEDRIVLVSFNDRVYLDSEFTGDHDKLRLALVQMQTGSSTRLYDALTLAMTERINVTPGRKAIVLFTDGVDDASGLSDFAGTLAKMEESDVPVYVIQYDTRPFNSRTPPPGFNISTAPEGYLDNEPVYARAGQYLQELSGASGGRLDRAASIGSISDAFSRIAEELRRQYTLCYYPSNQTRDGSYRRIRVEVDRPGVTVRARAAYRMSTKPIGGK